MILVVPNVIRFVPLVVVSQNAGFFDGMSPCCPSLSIQIRAMIDSQRLLVFPYMEKRDFINVFVVINNGQ
jgi:hypothetical protein